MDRREWKVLKLLACVAVAFMVSLVVAGEAFADAPRVRYRTNPDVLYLFDTMEGACSSRVASLNGVQAPPGPAFTYNGDYEMQGTNICYAFYWRTADQVVFGGTGITVQADTVCADGKRPTNTSLPLDQQCAPPPPVCAPDEELIGSTCFKKCPAGTRRYTAPSSATAPPSCVPELWCSGHANHTLACDSQGLGSATNIVRVGQQVSCSYPGGQSTTLNCDCIFCNDSEENPGETEEQLDKTCPEGTHQIGVDGQGNARCSTPDPDDLPNPCPAGTRNISADLRYPNCVTESPPVPDETTTDKTPTNTTQNPDGSTTTTGSQTVTNPDGSKKTTTTSTTTRPDGSTSTTVTESCKNAAGADVACGGGAGGGGGGGDGDDPTGVSGELWEKRDKTFADVMRKFRQDVEAAPFISAAKGFLSVQVGSAACPSWSAYVAYLDITISLGEYFCAPWALELFNLLGLGVMVAAAWLAWRIAFL